MPTVSGLAQEALEAAQADLVKFRRGLWTAVGLLALIHLLTFQPYLETARELAALDAEMAANRHVLAELAPEIERLEQANDDVISRLEDLLSTATRDMIDEFARLRALVARAEQGDLPQTFEPDSIPSPTHQMQQVQQMQIPTSNIGVATALSVVPPDLKAILEDIAAGENDAYGRLIEHARREIVQATYDRVQQRWVDTLKPTYLKYLDMTIDRSREAAARSSSSSGDTVIALVAAADQLSKSRDALAALEIRSDATVNEALGTDWWRTVQGKAAFADAIAHSISAQMADVASVAKTPATLIERTLVLQQALRDELGARQDNLEDRLNLAQQQLTTLSGIGGVLPVDLGSSIGLFPLLLGLVLGALILRAALARRRAAGAIRDLAAFGSVDRDVQAWLVRRSLGSSDSRKALAASVTSGIAVLAWVGFAAYQLSSTGLDMPAPLVLVTTAGAVAVVVAVFTDVRGVRDLSAVRAVSVPRQSNAAPCSHVQ